MAHEELIQRAVAGDEPALERLLLTYHRRLLGHIQRKLVTDVRNALQAEDVAQEAYVIVFREIAGFEPGPSEAFYRWLCKIAENRMRDLLRRQRAAKRGGGKTPINNVAVSEGGSLVDLLELLSTHSRTPSRSAAAAERVAAVQAALLELNAAYREALTLRYVEALPVAQIAEKLGRTEGAVHQLCHRALQRLGEIMGGESRFLTRKH